MICTWVCSASMYKSCEVGFIRIAAYPRRQLSCCVTSRPPPSRKPLRLYLWTKQWQHQGWNSGERVHAGPKAFSTLHDARSYLGQRSKWRNKCCAAHTSFKFQQISFITSPFFWSAKENDFKMMWAHLWWLHSLDSPAACRYLPPVSQSKIAQNI